jgi:L-seryl-tRNA(Ser) seleniumtransferase
LLESPPLKSLVRQVNQSVVTSGVRSFLERLRTDVQNASGINVPSPNELAERIAKWIAAGGHRALRPAVNATGSLIHPTLGSPPLADEALQAIASLGANYASILGASGSARRGRNAAVERLLTQFTGAEAAMVVNSGAAANLLAIASLASCREVVVARQEMIDTGDGYRVANAIAAAGGVVREVGSAKRCSLEDFAVAVTGQTAVILRVHSSSFQQLGDVTSVSLSELAQFARRMNLSLVVEAGAGALVDFNRYGVLGEPVVADIVKAGADLVLFSGDKLLGGPPCGILVGRQAVVDRLAQHPLARALEADKLTLAGLHATLELYQSIDTAERSIPLLTLLSTPLDNLKNRAERLAPQIQSTTAVAGASAVEDETYLAGAEIPRHRLATWCVSVTPAEGTVEQLAARLEAGTPSLVVRIGRGRLLIDLRSIRPRHDQEVVTAFQLLSQATDTTADTTTGPPSK